MSSLSVFSPTGLRLSTTRFLCGALAAAIVSGCAAGDGIDNPDGASGPGSGGGSGSGGAAGTGGDGSTVSTGADATTGGTASSGSPVGSTSTGPGGGEGGDTGASTGAGQGGQGQGGDGGSPPAPVCGDDAVDAGEDCDGAMLAGATCTSVGQGFVGGTLACTGGCDFDTSGCIEPPECGDGVIEGSESCDLAQLGSATCTTIGLGFIGGTLACTDACAFDTTGCTAPPECGDGVIEGGEACDLAQLGGATCGSLGFVGGMLTCSGACQLDTSGCTTCGDGVVNGSDVCDGAALGAATCQSLGHDGGTLTCAASCQGYVETACTDCGDGLREAPESCDGNNFGGATCASLGFTGGTLLCNGTCSVTSTANCYTCGNGTIEGAEACDGANLGGQTCQSLGYELGGTLACNAGCLSVNTSACVDSQCNNGTDDDGDGYVDLADLGCSGSVDSSEAIYANDCNGVGGTIFDISQADTSQDFYVPLDTTGFPDATNAPCQGNTGSEVVMVYRNVAFENDIIITTDFGATAIDTVLTVRRGTCNGGTFVCNDDIDGSFNRQSLVTVFNVQPGELLFITVEGYGAEAGLVDLVVDLESN